MSTTSPSRQLTIDVAPPDSADARWCIDRYFDELASRIGGDFDRTRTHQVDDSEITPPNGFILIARIDGRPVGCAALKLRDGVTGEIKRMWVDASVRGQGIARALLERLESMARENGLSALRLDSNGELKEAHALYRSSGYHDIERFNDEPYAHHWFGKSLE